MNEIFSDVSNIVDIDTISDYPDDYLAETLNISSDLLTFYRNWTFHDSKWYYYKNIYNEKFLLNELLGVKLAEYFAIDSISYLLGRDSEQKYILSENFRNKETEYLYTDELGIPNFSYGCENIQNFVNLKYICPSKEEYRKLLENLFKLCALDFYSAQTDRHENNLLFTKNKNNELSICKLFDYEASFVYSENNLIDNPFFTAEIFDKATSKLFKRFPEAYKIFLLILKINLEQMLKSIIQEYNLKFSKDLIDEYIEFDKMRKILINNIK